MIVFTFHERNSSIIARNSRLCPLSFGIILNLAFVTHPSVFCWVGLNTSEMSESESERSVEMTHDTSMMIQNRMNDLPKMICFQSINPNENVSHTSSDNVAFKTPIHAEGISADQAANQSSFHHHQSGYHDKNDETLIKHKQNRLLLLWHSSHCTINEGEYCPVTSHCTEIKALKRHIINCKSKECHYPKCLTSRHIIGHYKKCFDRSCLICIPVKQKIKDLQKENITITP
mmetsp:Transcript_28031/g.41921  ORF Transcript_28031/g.41921 Transcript_28031/m.41921 type:complete len:231 (-) Transcript_28031:42-734(-)